MKRLACIACLAALALSACTNPTIAGATSTPGGSAAGECDHPYFPLAIGSRWTYSDGRTWTVSNISNNGGEATVEVTLTVSDDGTQHKSEWKCAQGAVIGGVLATLYGQGTGSEAALLPNGQTLVNTAGQFLPLEAQLTQGFSWTQTFSEQMQVTGASTTRSAVERYAVTSAAPVDFQGRSYPALQIDGTLVANEAQTSGDGLTQTVTRNVNFALQLARGVGLVELTLTDPATGQSADLRLQSYEHP